MNYEDFAKREFLALGYAPVDQLKDDDPNKWIQEGTLELLKVFSGQGHSGFSAAYAIETFSKLASFKPLSPLTGEDSEWNDISEMSGRPMWQNNRYSSVFKNENGIAYDIAGIVWIDPQGTYYTDNKSSVEITFPYTPTVTYSREPKRKNK